MATKKELRKLKKSQALQERTELKKDKAIETATPEFGIKLDRAARKAEKARRAEQKALREQENKEKIAKARAAAESSRKALDQQEAEIQERDQVLQQQLTAGDEEQTSGNWLVQGLAKTRNALAGGLGRLVLGKKEIDRDVMDGLEELLIQSDIGVETTQRLLEAVRARVRRKEVSNPDALAALVKEEIRRVMKRSHPELKLSTSGPTVLLFIGVNGTGKTTTIGKIAAQYVEQGKKVLLVAGDTFRAAAADQLEGWAGRVGCAIFRKEPGADPSGVIHQAMETGRTEGYDIILCDTAGRLHTKFNLMEELKKIKRVIGKAIPEAPHETYLVLDANTGQNAIFQTRQFNQEIGITGLVITKLDGTARGGVVVGIVNEFDIPVRYIGVGEAAQDLKAFDPEAFAGFILSA